MIRTLAAALLMLAPPAFAQSASPPQMSDADEGAVQQALNRGTLIYYYDQAAWHGTDDMLTKLDDATKATIGGWIVDGSGASTELVFYDNDKTDPHALYVAHFDDEKLVSSEVLGPNDDRSLSPARKALIVARNAASDALANSNATRCVDKGFNTVVLPPETPVGPTLVYFLTPQTTRDSVPAGGHYRVEVAADGKAGPIRPFTKSCIELSTADNSQKGEHLAGLTITHLLDPTPTEIHVFTMFATSLPLYVSTEPNGRLWLIEFQSGRARITLLDPSKVK